MKRLRRLESALRILLGQSRLIRWFPLVGISLQGFIYFFALLTVVLLIFFVFMTPVY